VRVEKLARARGELAVREALQVGAKIRFRRGVLASAHPAHHPTTKRPFGELFWNNHGQAPTAASTDTFVAITCGAQHTCGIRSDGKVVCWGKYYYYTTPVPPGDSFRAIATGGNHSCGIRFDDRIVCWRYDNDGQLLAGPSIDTYLSLAAEGDTTCGVRSDRRIVCWGGAFSGQTRALLVVP
jgi:hypothetical protein